MLCDLTRDDWVGMLGLGEHQLPRVAILRGTRNLKRHYAGHRALFDDVIDVGTPNALFEDVLLGTYRGVPVGYASVYGPAMASEIAHLFAVLGAGLLVQTGVCGGLADGLDAGDLVFPTSAGCGEGAASLYLPGVTEVPASPADLAWLQREVRDVPAMSGPQWTTSALLAERLEDCERWHQEGYIAVDMETATTFAVAQSFGRRAVSVLSVFDNPRHGAHLGMVEDEKDAARERGESEALRLVLGLVERERG